MATRGNDVGEDQRLTQLVRDLSGRYQTVGEMVVAILREAINNGTFGPGEWLRQEALASAMGVSRIPVRTALMQLESEGLLTFHPHRGARVRSLTLEQIDEIYRLRGVLESVALRRSMEAMTPGRASSLRRLAGSLDEERHGTGFLAARVAFYWELYDGVRNPLLVRMIEDLRGMVGRFLLSVRLVGGEHGDHLTLVRHVLDGDELAAETWLLSHLEGVRIGIRSLVEAAAAASHDPPPKEEGRRGKTSVSSTVPIPAPASRPRKSAAVTGAGAVKPRTAAKRS